MPKFDIFGNFGNHKVTRNIIFFYQNLDFMENNFGVPPSMHFIDKLKLSINSSLPHMVTLMLSYW